MATKEAVFNVKVNTGNSVKEVQDLDKSLDNLNKATDETTKSTRDVNATFEQVYGELQPLTTRLGEAEDRLYELALAGEQASDEYKELLETVTNYRKTQIAVDATVDASASTMTTKLVAGVELGAGAFQAYESAVALAGVENEALVQTMVKLQAIQGLVGSIQSMQLALKESTIAMRLLSGLTLVYNTAVGTSTGLMKLFRIALISTGIGAIVVALGLLIANFDKIISLFSPLIDGFKAIGDAIGLTDFAGEERRKNIAKQYASERAEIEKTLEKHKEATKAIEKRYDRELDIARATGEGVAELEKEKLNVLIERLKQEAILEQKKGELAKRELEETKASYKKLNAAQRAFLEDGLKRVEDINKKNLEALNEQILDYENALEVNAINEDKKRKENNKKAVDDAKKRRQDLINLLQKQFDDELKLQDELEKNKLALITDARTKELETAQQSYNDYKEKFLLERTKDEKEAIDKQFVNGKISREKYDQEIADLRLNALNKLTEEERKILVTKETKLFQDLSAINKKFDEQELKELAEKEKEKAELRETYLSIFRDQFEKQTEEAKKANEEQIKELEKANKQGLISDGEFYLAKLKLANDLADKEKEIEKEKNEYIKEQNIKAREEQLKGITQVIEGAQKGLEGLSQINALANEIDQARLNTIANNRDENLENLDRNLQAQLNNENLTAEQKAQIEENFAQQKFVIQQKAFEEEDKIKRAQFNRDKALKLAQVSIDTASAIVKAIAQFGPPPSPLGIAGIASAGVIGLTQALAILNQQYQGGSAPSPPQVGGGASAGSLTGAGASTFTANTQAEQTDLSTIGQDVPVSQVVVLESDITGTQSKVAVQEAKSSF
jgi:hypothetical protein